MVDEEEVRLIRGGIVGREKTGWYTECDRGRPTRRVKKKEMSSLCSNLLRLPTFWTRVVAMMI